MKKYMAVAATLFFCLAFLQLAAAAPEDFRGSWTVSPSAQPGHVQLGLHIRKPGTNMMSQNDWQTSKLQGLDIATAAKHDVVWAIVADAGRIDAKGYIEQGEGAGTFQFTADPKFVGAMRAIGFDGIDDGKQFAMALHGISLDYARQMKAEKLEGLSTDQLIAFGIFNVTSAYIRELRAEGISATKADQIVAFRVHDISPAYIRGVKAWGLKPTEDQLVAMKIHGVTPEWAQQMAGNGYADLSIDSMIAFRIHEVTPEYIEKVEAMGFKHPAPDDLLAMRIHDVTPEYIRQLQSRGLQDLTIDKLVSHKIHGID